MEGYIVSFAVTLGLISIFRWNWHGIVVPLVTGIVSVFIGGIYDLGLVLSNTLGYLFLLPVLFWFKKKDKKAISKDIGFLLGYFFSGYISVEIGRTLCQLIDVRDIAKLGTILYSYFVIDLLNIGIGLLVFFIACKQKNLVVDMNFYLIELHTKPASADAREEKKDYLSLESMCDYISEVNDYETLLTVKAYIENGNSPSLLAIRLFVHRNTVTYRIDRFMQETNIDLKPFANACFIFSLIDYKEKQLKEDFY